MRILGIDPGSTMFGWALLETRGGADGLPRTAVALSCGMTSSTMQDATALLSECRAAVVAIEKLEGYAFKREGKGANAVVAGLVSSSYVAGGIAWLAWSRGVRVEERTALVARRTVLGRGAATDKHIAHVVPSLVHAWPKVSNPHQRDAAIVALSVAWTMRATRAA